MYNDTLRQPVSEDYSEFSEDEIDICDEEEKEALEWKLNGTNEINRHSYNKPYYEVNKNEARSQTHRYNNEVDNIDNIETHIDNNHRIKPDESDDEVDDYVINGKETNAKPDKSWLVPPTLKLIDLFGPRKSHLQRIKGSTSTDITYNKEKSSIEIWGDVYQIEEAVKQLDNHADNMLAKCREREKTRRAGRFDTVRKISDHATREPAWAKPDKAPVNEKRELMLKRRKDREDEENSYLKPLKDLDLRQFRFFGYFHFPRTDIPIERFIGKEGETLNPLRIETKCHIWYEPKISSVDDYVIKIAGNSKESVEEATTRVRNLFGKICMSKSICKTGKTHSVLHLLESPRKPYKVRIADPPASFHLPHDKPNLSNFKLLEPVYEGEMIPTVGKIDISEESKPSFEFDVSHSESNIKRIEESLIKAFETVHLLDEQIKMRIRFGHVCLTRVRDFSNALLSTKILNEKVLNHTRFETEFATCLATKEQQLNRLFETLSQHNRGLSREFKIRANRKAREGMGHFPCAFDVKFEKNVEDIAKNVRKCDGKIRLWDAIIDEKDVLDISMICLDNDYSWKLKLQVAKFLPNNVQEKFVEKLRICPQGRLIYSNIDEIKVFSVCEKTKWKYGWNEHYIIEITKYEFWNLSDCRNMKPGIEILLSKESPPVVSYGVTLYKKSWDDTFAFNRNLKVGEVPEWDPDDIMDEEQTGGVNNLLENINKFLEVLQSKLPTSII